MERGTLNVERLPGRVYFIGAGPGDPELLTIKAKRLIDSADVLIYTDSLVNPEVCRDAKPEAEIHGSAGMVLEQIMEIMLAAVAQGKTVARIHTGDPSLYGAVFEQASILKERGVPYEVVPGVSALFAAAAALPADFTIPEMTQTLIVTRMEGRTPVPGGEKLRDLARHRTSLALFLSVALIRKVVEELRAADLTEDTPVVVVARASWPDQQVVEGTLADIADRVREARITKQAMILIGNALAAAKLSAEERARYRSRLYDPSFQHMFRKVQSPKSQVPSQGRNPSPSPSGRG